MQMQLINGHFHHLIPSQSQLPNTFFLLINLATSSLLCVALSQWSQYHSIVYGHILCESLRFREAQNQGEEVVINIYLGVSVCNFYTTVHGITNLLCCVVLRCVGISLRHSHVQDSDIVYIDTTYSYKVTTDFFFRFRIHRHLSLLYHNYRYNLLLYDFSKTLNPKIIMMDVFIIIALLLDNNKILQIELEYKA